MKDENSTTSVEYHIPMNVDVPSILKQPPPIVGYWKLDQSDDMAGSVLISMKQKPTEDQIKNTETTFGWKWIDAKDNK